MTTFACDYRAICDKFCKKSKKGEHEFNIPTCKELENPSTIKQIFRIPVLLINREKAQRLAQETYSLMFDIFPSTRQDDLKCNSWHNGKADAFRHCHWVCSMAKEFGSKKALKIADFYEWSHPNVCEEEQMDFHNNRVGASIAQEGQPCAEKCQTSPNLTILEEERCR